MRKVKVDENTGNPLGIICGYREIDTCLSRCAFFHREELTEFETQDDWRKTPKSPDKVKRKFQVVMCQEHIIGEVES
jgi:hypothetical protein